MKFDICAIRYAYAYWSTVGISMLICSSSSNNAWCLVFARTSVCKVHTIRAIPNRAPSTLVHCLLLSTVSLCELCREAVLHARLCCVHAKQVKAFTVIHYYNYKHSFSFSWSVVFLLLTCWQYVAVWYAMPWFTILYDERTEYRIRSTDSGVLGIDGGSAFTWMFRAHI